ISIEPTPLSEASPQPTAFTTSRGTTSRRMHVWAQMVEGFSGQVGENFKQDSGDHVIQRFARALSELYAHEDGGTTPPAHLNAEFETLWIQVDAALGPTEETE
ncbi:hypothetical protein, partial [Brevibacterium gallinarum]|uniref:hypothetical protein n=1 Tax=Brevibacterium gallinarum TaxID=2762220 RepID=UPI001CD88C6C